MTALVDILEDYKAGYLDTQETLKLFAEVIHRGQVWNLENPHPLTARRLIDAGYITPDGKITDKGRALIFDDGREGSPCDANPEIDEASDEPVPGPFAVPDV